MNTEFPPHLVQIVRELMNKNISEKAWIYEIFFVCLLSNKF
jgi:hypothetical protein